MNANLCIAAGTLIMAIGMSVGGLITTYGWNLRTSKKTQILLKEARLDELALRRFRTEAMSSVMNSALFHEKKHKSFLDQVSNTQSHLAHFNRYLDLSEMQMRRIGVTPEQRASLRQKLRDGMLRQDAGRNLKELLDIMLSLYEDLFLGQFESELDEDAKAWVRKYRSQNNYCKTKATGHEQ